MAKWISILLGITIGLSNSLRAEDEVWIQQGVRLEKVGATLVDAYPITEYPSRSALSLDVKASASFLPNVNSTVGSKTENFPVAPVHALPIVQLNATLRKSTEIALVGKAWLGAYVPGSAGLMGVDANITQVIGGAALSPQLPLGHTIVSTPIFPLRLDQVLFY